MSLPKLSFFTKPTFFLSLIVIGVCLIHVSELISPMIAEPDAYSRVLSAFADKNNDTLFITYPSAWLPLHSSLLVISLYIYNNIYISPRVITLIFSLLTIVIMYPYSQLFFKSRNARLALFTCLLFGLFPLNFYLATTTMSEPIFIFFLIASLVLLIPQRHFNDYLAGIFILNIATGIRYEAWFILPFIWCFLLTKDLTVQKKLLLFMGTLVFPVVWVYLNFTSSDHSLYFFTSKQAIAAQTPNPLYWDFFSSLKAWLFSLNNVFPLSLLCLAIVGAFSTLYKNVKKDQILLAVLPIYLFFSLVFQVYFGTMEWLPHRYLSILISLAFPLVGSGIYYFYLVLKEVRLPPMLIKGVLLGMLSFFYVILFRHTKQSIQLDNTYTDQEMQDMFAVKKYLSDSSSEFSKNISYFYPSETNRRWLNPGFFYFFNPETDINRVYPISQLEHQSHEQFNIYEKPFEVDYVPYQIENSEYEVVYSNSTFLVFTRKE